MATSEGAKTAKTWFQGKRVPLYILVGGSLIGAASYLSTRATHPHVESSKLLRQDPVPEERESAAGEGAAHKESTGRKTTRALGLFDGQNSDGILPNNKISKKIGDITGQNDPSAPRS